MTLSKLTHFILALLITVAATPSLAAVEPFEAKYKASRGGKDIGEAEYRLSKNGNNQFTLFYKSDLSLFVFSDKREETSIFKLDDNQAVKPITYRYRRTGFGKSKELDLNFDSNKKQISFAKGDPINWNNEWDNQLYRLDLQLKLKAGVKKAEYDLINYRGQKKTYAFEVVAEEMLTLPYGKISAIKVKTIRNNKKRETYSWFAPDLDYVLVRLRQFKDGKEQGDIQLTSFELLNRE